MQRRSFFKWLFASVSALWGAGLAGLSLSYLKPTKALSSLESSIIRVGLLEELKIGNAQFVPHAQQPIWVMRLASNEVIALSAICTHRHCILKWENAEKMYQCPCHRGSFDSHGNVLAGPPPSALPKLPVEIRRGEIYVHVG